MTEDSNSDTRTEHVFVLYGSQTGNAEQAAEDFSKKIQAKFTPKYFKDLDLDPVSVETTCISLDDFLEYRHAAFTKTIVIFVSSYGVGQAPMGSQKFRVFAEELMTQTESGKSSKTLLKGLNYAVCGLGDSNYTTYLDNPTTIDNALKDAGGTQLIEMGKADAQEIGENSQENTILKWKEELWIPLAKAVASSEKVDLKEMQKGAIPILVKADPEYTPPKEFGGQFGGGIPLPLLIAAIILALIAALYATGSFDTP